MKPFIHAKNSAEKFGGKPEDYLEIHNFMDSSKAVVPDMRHRAIFHSAFGCFIVEKVFGTTIKNSDGEEVSTRDIAEEHILEDLGMIPTLQDWLNEMQFQDWMMSPELRKNYQDPAKNPCTEIELEGPDINEKERSQIKSVEQDLSEYIPLKYNPIILTEDYILDGARPLNNEFLTETIKVEPVKKDDVIKVKDGKRSSFSPGRRVLDGRPRHRPSPNPDNDIKKSDS